MYQLTGPAALAAVAAFFATRFVADALDLPDSVPVVAAFVAAACTFAWLAARDARGAAE